MKKVLSLIISIALCLAVCAPAFAADDTDNISLAGNLKITTPTIADGVVTVIIENIVDEAAQAVLVVAGYDESGLLIDANIASKPVGATRDEIFTAEIPENSASAKAFIWNNVDDMVPLAPVTEFDNPFSGGGEDEPHTITDEYYVRAISVPSSAHQQSASISSSSAGNGTNNIKVASGHGNHIELPINAPSQGSFELSFDVAAASTSAFVRFYGGESGSFTSENCTSVKVTGSSATMKNGKTRTDSEHYMGGLYLYADSGIYALADEKAQSAGTKLGSCGKNKWYRIVVNYDYDTQTFTYSAYQHGNTYNENADEVTTEGNLMGTASVKSAKNLPFNLLQLNFHNGGDKFIDNILLRYSSNLTPDSSDKAQIELPKASIIGADQIIRPASGTAEKVYVCGETIQTYTWSLGGEYAGVSINSDTGALTVSDEAAIGKIKVKVTSTSDPTNFAEQEVYICDEYYRREGLMDEHADELGDSLDVDVSGLVNYSKGVDFSVTRKLGDGTVTTAKRTANADGIINVPITGVDGIEITPNYRFDFGTTKPVSGYIGVPGNTVYNPKGNIYGFSKTLSNSSGSAGNGDKELKAHFVDFGSNNVGFKVDLPDGLYDFTFYKAASGRAHIWVNGLLVGSNVDMSDSASSGRSPSGATYTAKDVKVSGGCATITMSEKSRAIGAVDIIRKSDWAKRPTHVYVGGDSTVCSYYPLANITSTGGIYKTGWGQVFDKFISDELVVDNLAVSGTDAKYCYDNLYPTVLENGRPGDYFLMQYGINDGSGGSYVTTEQMVDYLTKMVAGCREKGIIPVLVTPQNSYSRWGSVGDWEKPDGNSAKVAAIRELAQSLDTLLIDNAALSAEWFGMVGKEYTGLNYNLSSNGTIVDKLHMSYVGSMKIAELCATSIFDQAEEGKTTSTGESFAGLKTNPKTSYDFTYTDQNGTSQTITVNNVGTTSASESDYLYNFSFGSGTASDGSVRVSAADTYNYSIGYGFTTTSQTDKANCVEGDLMSFKVNGEEGANYTVTITYQGLLATEVIDGTSDKYIGSLHELDDKTAAGTATFVVPCVDGALDFSFPTSVTKRASKNSTITSGATAQIYSLAIKKNAQNTAAEKPSLYIIGDSTASNGSSSTSWGQVAQNFTDVFKIENRGTGGRTATGYYQEGRLDNILNTLCPGDYVTINMGINGTTDMQTTLQYYVNAIKQRGGIPIILTCTPHGCVSSYANKYNSSTQTFSANRNSESSDQILTSLAQSNNLELINVGKLADEKFTSLCKEARDAIKPNSTSADTEAWATGEAVAQNIIANYVDHNHYKEPVANIIAPLILEKAEAIYNK